MFAQKLPRKLGSVWLLGLLWTAAPLLFGLLMVARLATLADLLAAHQPLSLPGWTVLTAVGIGAGVLPVYSNTFLCGWVFGWKWGAASAMTSYMLAAAIGYALARRLSFARVNDAIEEHEGARRVRNALVRESRNRSLLIVTLWRLSGSPFPLTTLVMASCGVPGPIFYLGTLLGLSPRVIVGTLVAATAAKSGARDIPALLRESENPFLLWSGIVVSILGLILIGHIARVALRRVTEEK